MEGGISVKQAQLGIGSCSKQNIDNSEISLHTGNQKRGFATIVDRIDILLIYQCTDNLCLTVVNRLMKRSIAGHIGGICISEQSDIAVSKQEIILPYVQKYSVNVTAAKAAEIREWIEYGGSLDEEAMYSLFTDKPKPIKKEKIQKPQTAIKYKQLKSYIPSSILKEDYEDYIIRALMFYRDKSNIDN